MAGRAGISGSKDQRGFTRQRQARAFEHDNQEDRPIAMLNDQRLNIYRKQNASLSRPRLPRITMRSGERFALYRDPPIKQKTALLKSVSIFYGVRRSG